MPGRRSPQGTPEDREHGKDSKNDEEGPSKIDLDIIAPGRIHRLILVEEPVREGGRRGFLT